nr:hypothetical protein [Tanacetum cinerariifolium]
MTTLAEYIIVARAKNRPPMLEKSMYDSWASHIRLFIKGRNILYAYLSQHEQHANEVRITRERYPDPLALVANSLTLYNPSQSPQHLDFHTEDLDAYDSDFDDLSSAKAVLMENLLSCDSDVLFETLILEEESRSKMLDKQNDPILIEKKIKISPIDYSKLNKIKEDFGKHFVTKKELSTEQAFWLEHSSFSETPVTLHTPVRIEAPSELSKVKENQEKDKIRSKPDKNRKRGEAGRSVKQLQ